VSEASEISLRERKKAKTRSRIVEEALRLFAANGYQQTTIAQIAEASEVSPRTVSTYFPAKEDLVFDISAGTKERLISAIRERPENEDTMSALRKWLLDERKLLEDEQDLHTCQRLVIDREEVLLAHEQAMMREFEHILASGLAVDLDSGMSDLQPRMAAAAAMAVFDLLHDEGHSNRVEGELPSVEEQLELLDQAFTFITGGVTALRNRQS
jgi:AcrR family transcriptional regulator